VLEGSGSMPSWDELTESGQMARIVAVGLACLVAGWQVITVAAAQAR